MKLFISADIEGVAGICAASEGDHAQPAEYLPFRKQMTDEVAAACAGAYAAGADSIVVKDAHYSGRNLDIHRLQAPQGRQLLLTRGWSGHPLSMVQGLDESFDALAFIGYHSAAGHGGNPLAHTVSGRMFARVELNGVPASEFLLFTFAAATLGVPVIFLSGDEALCQDARRVVEGIATVSTLVGSGASVTSITPAESVRRIEDGVRQALSARRTKPIALPAGFHLKVTFNKAADAYEKSFYPGARRVGDTEVALESGRYLDLLTFVMFARK
jgi:D-amino peptidase